MPGDIRIWQDSRDAGSTAKRLVESVLFLGGRRLQAFDPGLVHIDVAGRARAGAPASRLDGDAPVADHLHDAPAFERGKCMLAAMMIDDEKNDLFLGGFRGELFQGRSHW